MSDQSDIPRVTESIHSRKRVYFIPQSPPNASEGSPSPLVYSWLDGTDRAKSLTSNTSPQSPNDSIKLPGFLISLFRRIPHPITAWARQTFLPIGFPDSVHPVYARVHLLQFIETFLWSSVSVLCSQSMLESLGISSPAATGGAVAIQWVLKDQFGEIGKLMFINRFAKSLDSHPKTWKFVGEIASLSGALMQLCTILNPSPAWFLTFASFGYAMRSIHFSIYNSTHMTFTRNFALQGNVGDIVAKDDSQQTIAHLLGLLTGITLLTVNHSPIFLFSCFFLIAPAHYHATIAFLNATRFEVLHATNLRILAREYVAAGEAQAKGVLSFDEVSAKGETVWFGESLRATWSGAKISVVGGTVDAVFDTAQALADSWRVLKDQNYLIGYRTATDSFGITFHQDATSSDVIKSIIHVTKLHKEMKSRNSADAANSSNFSELLQSTLEWTVSEYPRFAVDLEAKGWLTDAVFWGDEGNRSTWDRSRPTD